MYYCKDGNLSRAFCEQDRLMAYDIMYVCAAGWEGAQLLDRGMQERLHCLRHGWGLEPVLIAFSDTMKLQAYVSQRA